MKTALIINFTGNTYHFGCYGTAREIYRQLEGKGYLVNYLSVKVTHGTAFVPDKVAKFFDKGFAQQYVIKNFPIYASICEADVVVVNGEGTLHGFRKGSIHLLYMTYISQRLVNKPTYLINHSCFPDSGAAGNKNSGFYQKALQAVKGIVPRESESAKIYDTAGITYQLGFDSLPLYIKREGLLDLRKEGYKSNSILLCGGINYLKQQLVVVANILRREKADYKIKFLFGGKADLPKEEEKIYSLYQSSGVKVELVQAKTFEEWIREIAQCGCLISGRFHYTVAAFALGTPSISFPSNTPKVKAIHKMFDHQGHLEWNDSDFAEQFRSKLDDALSGGLKLEAKQREHMLDLAMNNYRNIPEATI